MLRVQKQEVERIYITVIVKMVYNIFPAAKYFYNFFPVGKVSSLATAGGRGVFCSRCWGVLHFSLWWLMLHFVFHGDWTLMYLEKLENLDI